MVFSCSTCGGLRVQKGSSFAPRQLKSVNGNIQNNCDAVVIATKTYKYTDICRHFCYY